MPRPWFSRVTASLARMTTGSGNPPHALTDALWGLQRVDLAHGEAEVAGDAILLVGDDECSGRATGLRLAGMVQ